MNATHPNFNNLLGNWKCEDGAGNNLQDASVNANMCNVTGTLNWNSNQTETFIVAMMHVNKAGESKLLKKCTLPLTGVKCVKKVVTELAVLEITDEGFRLLERAPGVSVDEIVAATEGRLIVDDDIPEMQLD